MINSLSIFHGAVRTLLHAQLMAVELRHKALGNVPEEQADWQRANQLEKSFAQRRPIQLFTGPEWDRMAYMQQAMGLTVNEFMDMCQQVGVYLLGAGTPIVVWPNYVWCYEDELSEFGFMSDDFMRVEVPPEVKDIDVWLNQTKPQG